MTPFIEGPFCRQYTDCEKCRDTGARGETFRVGLVKLGIPLPAAPDPAKPHDFDCPIERGVKPWGWKKTATPLAPPVQPTKPKEWPMLARAVRWMRNDGERGVGDTVARLATGVGGDSVADWYTRITGKSCGCKDRQGKLNAMFPYG